MFVSNIRIQNYRCFRDTSIDFRPGLNVIIGENNAGKTTLLKALALVFDRRGRSRPTVHDFHCLILPLDKAPCITVAVTIRSSANDTAADRALVATWLTTLDGQWEAQLTYKFFLPEQHAQEFTDALDGSQERGKFFEVVDEFLPKYVSRVYGGNPDTLVAADGESLAKFDCQFLDALRDVESEMFSGSTPLFRTMLEEVLDLGKEPSERRGLRDDFRAKSNTLREELVNRLDTKRLFDLVNVTGAADGGTPKLHGAVEEADLIAALRLFIDRQQFAFPATHQGLGYNNLLYISLMLASLAFRASEERRGQNAAIFPMLLVEEPEAHLHPALQYKLLAHIVSRVESEPRHNRQVFVTTHSTHVTSAARLDPIICLSIDSDETIRACYPARVFPDTKAGKASRGYVERYLDATKSTMLFAKAILFVEGIAEQLMIPALAEKLNRPFDQHHVAVVRVDGLTFKHFLPLFGAGAKPESKEFTLSRKVACVVDSDPTRKEKNKKGARWRSCFPFQLGRDAGRFEYQAQSGALKTLDSMIEQPSQVCVFYGVKTFEYDLALANYCQPELITEVMKNVTELVGMSTTPEPLPDALSTLLNTDECDGLAAVTDASERLHQQYAAIYLRCAEDCKGEHAFALEQSMRSNKAGAPALTCPDYIRRAIEWVTPSSSSVQPGP